MAGWLVRERRSLDILPVKKEAKIIIMQRLTRHNVGHKDDESLVLGCMLPVTHQGAAPTAKVTNVRFGSICRRPDQGRYACC